MRRPVELSEKQINIWGTDVPFPERSDSEVGRCTQTCSNGQRFVAAFWLSRSSQRQILRETGLHCGSACKTGMRCASACKTGGGLHEACAMPRSARPAIREKDITGLKDFDQLAPLLERERKRGQRAEKGTLYFSLECIWRNAVGSSDA